MVNKKTIMILIISSVSVLVILSALVIARIIIINSVIVGGRGVIYIDDYDEFYLSKEDYKPLFSFDFGEGGPGKLYKISFLIGQKGKLLKKIKEDINIELENIMTNNSNIIKGYKISDDFKRVYIYFYKNAKLPYGFDGFTPVTLRLELYLNFVHGYWGAGVSGNIINFVENN